MRSPSQRTPPRTGPLAQSVDLQCPFDACSCLRQLRTWKSSQVLYYLPSRHNRRCNMAHGDQARIQSILRWCTETAIRLFVLVSVFLAIRVAVDVVCSHLHSAQLLVKCCISGALHLSTAAYYLCTGCDGADSLAVPRAHVDRNGPESCRGAAIRLGSHHPREFCSNVDCRVYYSSSSSCGRRPS